jgi:hypothetical protein
LLLTPFESTPVAALLYSEHPSFFSCQAKRLGYNSALVIRLDCRRLVGCLLSPVAPSLVVVVSSNLRQSGELTDPAMSIDRYETYCRFVLFPHSRSNR